MSPPGGAGTPTIFLRFARRARGSATLLLVLLALIVAGELGLALWPAVAREPAREATVIGETRLRAEPRRKGKPLVRLPAGARVTVRGKPEAGWYRARRGPIEGYILSGSVATAPLPPSDDPQPGEAIDDPRSVELAQRADGGERRDRGNRDKDRKRDKNDNDRAKGEGKGKAKHKAKDRKKGKDARKADRKRERKAQRKQERRQARERGDVRRDYRGLITSTELNLRADPVQEARVLETIPRGDRVEPTGQHEDGWVELRWDGQTGWALGRYLAAPRAVIIRQDDDPSWSRQELKDIIFAAADRYGQPREDMLRVARCESNMIPAAVNEHGGSYGLFQFKPGTWLSTPFADYDIFDPRASANAAAWMWDQGRRREWVCQ